MQTGELWPWKLLAMAHKVLALPLIVLALSALACGTYITPTPTLAPTVANTSTPSPTPQPTAQPSPSPAASVQAQTATVSTAVVRVHAEPDVLSATTASLEAGQIVTVLECADNFCKIEQPAGWVWRGCLSDNPEQLGCEAR